MLAGWVVPRDDVLFTPQQRSSWWWPLWMRLKRLRLFLWQELIPGRAIVSNNKRVLNQVGGHVGRVAGGRGLLACTVVVCVQAPCTAAKVGMTLRTACISYGCAAYPCSR